MPSRLKSETIVEQLMSLQIDSTFRLDIQEREAVLVFP